MNNRTSKYRTVVEALSDLELVNAYKQTLETNYVGVLYQRYQHIVTGICLKYLKDVSLANDATLELFSNLFSNLLKYEVHEFKGWLLTITRNHCQRVLKEQAKVIPISQAVEQTLQHDSTKETDIDELTHHEVLLEHLACSLEKLKPEQESCVRLFYLEGLSYDQIALQTGYELGKVKSYIQNGKRNLQLMLNNFYDRND